MTEMNVLAEYRKLTHRAMDIKHEKLRDRMLDFLNAARDYAEIVSTMPPENLVELHSDINPVASDVGAAKMKLRFTHWARAATEINIVKLDMDQYNDRKLVGELIGHHTMLAAHVTKANVPASMHDDLRHAYLSGVVNALPAVPTIQSVVRRARAAVSRSFHPSTSH